MSSRSVLLMMLVGWAVCGLGVARKNKDWDPRNITHCDSGPSGIDSIDWNAFRGRWYVSRISAPLGPSLREVSGYATDIDVSSIEPNARDKAFRGFTVERKETLINGDSRKCRKRKWQCRREQGTSQTECILNADGVGLIVQKSVILATDYITSAAVYRETFINGQFLSKQINLLVRDANSDPDVGVVGPSLREYCGRFAADPNSEFYKTFSNDSSRSCFLP